MVSFKLEFDNFVDGMPRMLPHNVDINIYRSGSVSQFNFNFKLSQCWEPNWNWKWPFKNLLEIHKVLNLNIDKFE